MQNNSLLLAAFALLAVASLTSCNNNNDPDIEAVNVPEAVASAFNAQYPSAARQLPDWQHRGKYYTAEFDLERGAIDAEAWYYDNGQWAMTQMEYGQSIMFLPENVVYTFAKSEYGGWRIQEVDEYQYPNSNRNLYVISVETDGGQEADLYYKLVNNQPELVNVSIVDYDITPDWKF